MTLHSRCDIDAPPTPVWVLLADVLHWHGWTKAVGNVATWPPGPVHVGQQATVPLRWLTGNTYNWTVTAVDPGRSFTWTSGGFNNNLIGTVITGTHEVTPTATGCTVDISMVFTGHFGSLAERTSRRGLSRYLRTLTEDLKIHAESTLPPAA